MRLTTLVRTVLALATLGAVGVVVAPPDARGYSTIGHALGLEAREVGVFDNFTDATANDNITAHPNWPSFTGVELACWKAVTEWQSELFGDGSGDPLQTDGVGSGGANFDPAWAGWVTTVGGTSGNVISELPGSSGGILGFTEYGPNGWRIRLYSEWTWDDGPGAPEPGTIDVQAIITHEYGHALGLGHSTIGGATMFPSISGDGTSTRSIAADDQAGLQWIYGVKSASKPHISSISVVGSEIVIQGSNFAAFNDVWMTPDTAEPLPAMEILANVASTPTEIHLPLVPNAGAFLVHDLGVSHDSLSNSFPFQGVPGTLTIYCPGKANSLGCLSDPFIVGTLSASAGSGGSVVAASLLNNKFGLQFYGTSGPTNLPFSGGTLCVHPPIRRFPLHSTGGSPPPTSDCSGVLSEDVNAFIAGGSDPSLVVGAYIWVQAWSRDPGFAPPNNVGLSSGMRTWIGP